MLGTGNPKLLRFLCAKANNFAVIDILVVFIVILTVISVNLQTKWRLIYLKIIVNTCLMMLL